MPSCRIDPDASVVIISGSPVIGNFEFGSGVDYIRIPGVMKLPDGDYRSLNLNLALDEAVGLRQALILADRQGLPAGRRSSSTRSRPGFRGEVLPALDYLQGARLPPGARHPRRDGRARAARARMGAQGREGSAESDYYDEIWVYGLKESTSRSKALRPARRRREADHLYGLSAPRRAADPVADARYPKITKQPFILVTTGGGGDGDDLIDWVISAYEADPQHRPAGAHPVRPVHRPRQAPRLRGAHRQAAEARCARPSTTRSNG